VSNTTKIDYASVQAYYDSGHTPMECIRKYMGGTATWCKAVRKGLIKTNPSRERKRPDMSKDYEGHIFNDLTVLERVKMPRKRAFWKCRCKCGKVGIFRIGNLLTGSTKGCGCRRLKRGNNHHHWMGYKGISLTFWKSIVNACRTRGEGRIIKFTITIEQAWELFMQQGGRCALSGVDIVLSPNREERTASLDRKDSSGGYEEGNIQWVHKRVNVMKGDLPDSEFKNWCRIISNKP